jgi:putative ATPase
MNAAGEGARTPLAELLRPRTLDEVFGQRHLLGPGKPLRVAIASRRPHSMILWGPPGVGKTTLARLAAEAFDADFIQLSAVLAGTREIEAALAQAGGRRSILFIDEIHRLDTPRQAVLLPALQQGRITLIGATTENPSFALKHAFLSRLRVHVLSPLDDGDMRRLLARAQALLPGDMQVDGAALDRLAAHADGDARRCLNLLEQTLTAAQAAGASAITADFIEHTLTPQARRFDKGGEQFYDQISALHKSVRGSHPDAALYWLGRMLDGGADTRYLLRRMRSMAWDDIGLADPRAIRMVNAAADAWEQLGAPDGHLALAQAVVYLAVAAKSNAGGVAYGTAMQFVRGGGRLPVGVEDTGWYEPVSRGLEAGIAAKLDWLRSR